MQSSNIDVRNALQLSNYPPSFSILIGKAKSSRLITSYCLTGAVLFEIDVDPYANVDRVNPLAGDFPNPTKLSRRVNIDNRPALNGKVEPFTALYRTIKDNRGRGKTASQSQMILVIRYYFRIASTVSSDFQNPRKGIRFNRIAHVSISTPLFTQCCREISKIRSEFFFIKNKAWRLKLL